MDLWIRSQDKKQLRKIVGFVYQKGTIDDENNEAIFGRTQFGRTQYDEWKLLGIYKTKERALEVLDEIMDKMYSLPTNEDTIIYEMPEE